MNHQRPIAATAGISMLELSLAVFVLSVGLLTAISQINTLRTVRMQAQDIATVQGIVSAIAERFQGARWDTLGSTIAPWSISRTEPNAGVATVTKPLVDDNDVNLASFDENDDGALTDVEVADVRTARGLRSLGLIAAPTGIADLRIYIEYYRAVTMRDADGNPVAAAPGMMSGQDVTFEKSSEFTNRFRFNLRQEDLPAADRATIIANRNRYRLAENLPPGGQVGENEPIILRILATWSTRVGDTVVPSGQLCVITSRKP